MIRNNIEDIIKIVTFLIMFLTAYKYVVICNLLHFKSYLTITDYLIVVEDFFNRVNALHIRAPSESSMNLTCL